MSRNVEGGKESLEQLQLGQAMQEPGKQTQRLVSEGGTAELESFKREMITFKQATERQLERAKKFEASAEEKLDSLQTEIKELKVTSEHAIEGLRRAIDRQMEELVKLREKLNQKDEQEEAAGKHPGLQLVEDLQDSTVHKRPSFKTLGGCFRLRSSKKKAKEKKRLYEPSDLPTKVAKETTTGRRDVAQNDEFRGSQKSCGTLIAEETMIDRRDVGRHDEFRGSQKSLVAEETMIDRRDVGRHDEFRGSQKSSGEGSMASGYIRREGSRSSRVSIGEGSMASGYIRREGSRSSRVSIGIALPPRRRHSASSLVLCYSFNNDLDFEDFEESREPIKIDKHPESKTATVGSKVTFECRGQEKSTKLLYQWFKDDEPLPNENASILVLDSVRLRDFGYYMCNVSHQDSYDEGSKSSLAKLDVTPDGESGMRLKRLADLDFNTIEKVCVLLQNKKFGLGGWREVAAAYRMERYKIDDLDNSKEPGKSAMEFVTGTRPNLTVYGFCKVLKENPIKRLDVVNILEDHFLV